MKSNSDKIRLIAYCALAIFSLHFLYHNINEDPYTLWMIFLLIIATGVVIIEFIFRFGKRRKH